MIFLYLFSIFSNCVSVLAISGAFSKSFRDQLPFTPKISNFSSRLTIKKWYCNLIFHPCTFENNVDFCRCCSLLSSLSERKSGFKLFHGKLIRLIDGFFIYITTFYTHFHPVNKFYMVERGNFFTRNQSFETYRRRTREKTSLQIQRKMS